AKFVLFYSFVKSVSLKAEAWHSLSDIGSSFVVFLALYWGRRQARRLSDAERLPAQQSGPKSGSIFSTAEEPEKAEKPARRANPEDVVAVGIACLFIVVCFGIFAEVLRPAKVETQHALLVAGGMLLMAYASYLLYKFEYHVGVQSDSPGLIADGYHSKIDMYGSILVAVALVCQRIGFDWADRIIAGFICIGILGHAVEVLAMAARHYLGRPIDREETHGRGHAHAGALADVYALTGKWGERLSETTTLVLARVFLINRSQPELGRRVARRITVIAVLAALMLYGLSGLFACGPAERAFIERFGKPTSRTPCGPGLHYRFPWPVERAVKVNVRKVQTFCLGTRAQTSGQPILWTNRHYTNEFKYLTGDESFLSVFLVVHFRINDAYGYLYRCAEPAALLGNACCTKFREFAGRNEFFDCLTTKRPLLEKEIHDHLELAVKNVGIEILTVAIRDMHPPTDVAPSFEAVISAMEEKEALINQAKAYEIGAVPLAQGRAAAIQARARAEKTRTIEEAKARISAFLALQQQYAIDRDVTGVRMYLEMIEQTIANTPKWVVMDDAWPAPFELWFPRGGGFWRWNIGPGGQGDLPK
ncbi:MAG: FtsH protease activity modulator HflK, partial [Planctomycetota bacterium]